MGTGIVTALTSINGGGGGGERFKGTWEAATNTPTLVDGVGEAGDYYINVSTGTHNVDFGSGPILFNIDDRPTYDGTIWQRVPAAGQFWRKDGLMLSPKNLTDITRLNNNGGLQFGNGANVNDITTTIDATSTDLQLATAKSVYDLSPSGSGQFDATVGDFGTGADYNYIQDAINDSKYNLLIIGPQHTVALAVTSPTTDQLQITISNRLRFSAFGNITSNGPGIKIRGGEIETAYTGGTVNVVFSGGSPLDIADVSFIDNSTAGVNRLSWMSLNTQHIIHNCKFALPNNGNCGFANIGNKSSFTNLEVVGGGLMCNGFITEITDGIVSDVTFSGTWDSDPTIHTVTGSGVVLNNCIASTNQLLPIVLQSHFPQVSNLNGDFLVEIDGQNGLFSDLKIERMTFTAGSNYHYFTNCHIGGVGAITIGGEFNRFVNCTFTDSVTLDASSNNNQLLFCSAIGGFNDNGTDNSITEEIVNVIDSSSTDRQLPTAKSVYDLSPSGGVSQFDATVGEVASGADYNNIQDAINDSKYNLLILDTYTQLTGVNTGTNPIQITIAKRLIWSSGLFVIGAGGIKIRGGEIETAYTAGPSILFTGTGTLDIADVSFTDSSSVDARLGEMTGAKQIVHNCKFELPNNSSSGFYGVGNGSSFTNLDVVGGGTLCAGFLTQITDAIISDITFSGTWREMPGIHAIGASHFIMSNCIATTNVPLDVYLEGDDNQISNLLGDFSIDLLGNGGQFTDLKIQDLTFDTGASYHYFTNSVFNGANPISISSDFNRFVNCNFNAAVTLEATSNNNQLLWCKSNVGFTDNGTDNSITEEVTNVVDASSTRLQIADAKAIYDAISGITPGGSGITSEDLTAQLGAGGVTAFTLTSAPVNPERSILFYNGQQQLYGINYTISGTALTWITTPPSFVLDADDGTNSFWIYYDITIAPSASTPLFVAYNSIQTPNFTGDGLTQTIVLPLTQANVGGHYNPANGEFTAPVNGIYEFAISAKFFNIDSAHNRISVTINIPPIQSWEIFAGDPSNIRITTLLNSLSLSGSIKCELNASQTATIGAVVAGGAKTVTLDGGCIASGNLIQAI